jgi:hypothetical protein
VLLASITALQTSASATVQGFLGTAAMCQDACDMADQSSTRPILGRVTGTCIMMPADQEWKKGLHEAVAD